MSEKKFGKRAYVYACMRAMRVIFFLIFTGLLLSGAETVFAFGTFGGTELINVPTSSVLPPGGYSVGTHYAHDKEGITKVQFDLGFIHNLEIGAVVDLLEQEEDITGRIKYRLAPERLGSFGLAIGLEDLGSKTRSSYMMASQTLPQHGIRWHLGVGTGNLDGFFIGVNKVFNSIKVEGKQNRWPRVILIGEYNAEGLNIGTRIDVSRGFFLDLATIDLEVYTVGISYNKYL